MLYYHLDTSHQTILSGPHSLYDSELKRITACGNPECLDLTQYDLVPEWREAVDAPLGWQAPVIEARDGQTVVAVYAAGTPEEREAASAQARRAGMSCSKAQGKLELLANGLLETVETWVATQPLATQIEYADRGTWERTWPLVIQFAADNAISDDTLDAMFVSAAQR